jgi:RND family efflux transporter MFP subunit
MIKKLIIPAFIFILAFAFFAVMVSTREKSPVIETGERVWRVEQAEVVPQTLAPIITLYGKIETPDLFNAAAPINTLVEQVNIKEGEYVKKEQLLLTLDQRDFLPLLKQSRGKVDELNALIKSEKLKHEINLKSLSHEKKLLRLSEKALQRAETVKRKKLGSISETELAMQQVEKQRLLLIARQFSVDEHQARLEQLQARLLQAEAELEKSQLALERSKIYAPFSGVVAKVNVAAGDRVNNNEKLLSLYSMDKLEIRAKLPNTIMAEIKQDLLDNKTLTGMAYTGSKSFPIVLERLSGEGSASGVPAIFSVAEDNIRIRLGTIVVVRLQRTSKPDLIAVPYQAMYGYDHLYKIVDARLHSVTVETVGEYQLDAPLQSTPDKMLLIRSAELKAGDHILVTHLPNAFNGLKVETISASSSTVLRSEPLAEPVPETAL